MINDSTRGDTLLFFISYLILIECCEVGIVLGTITDMNKIGEKKHEGFWARLCAFMV